MNATTTTATTTTATTNEQAAGPWWRYPLLWMVIGGPVAVMIASFATFWLAWRSPDALVSEDYYREGIEINKTLAAKKLLPALAGRNHATTPADDMPQPARKAAP
ncbi:FixH family protein [Variovorax sp. Varisp62]|uniref:FixH family protein n=1 Tax=Variovorax sp. Varisp62 TaxID=3243049 RepID=UPI0039B3698F